MLHELQHMLQRLLYELGQISPQEVEIRFEAPTQEYIDRLLQPTINLFLFEISENILLRQSGYQTLRENGRAERRPIPKRFDLHYMVSALSSEVEDEHLLLWRVLTTLARYAQVPEELLSEEIRLLAIPLGTQLCQSEESARLLSVWNALGTQPRPALAYTVTVPVEMATVSEAPLVLTRVARYLHRDPGEQISEVGRQIGGVVRTTNGEPVVGARVSIEGRASECMTDGEGRFVLNNAPAGQLSLRITPADGEPRTVLLADSTSRPPAGAFAHNIVL